MESGGGCADIAAWLAERDLSKFNPKAQVAKTVGWQSVANTWGEPEDAISAALERLGRPDAFFGVELLEGTFDEREELAALLKSPRKLGHRLQRAGYFCATPGTKDGRWTFRLEGKVFRSRLAFVKAELTGDMGTADDVLRERGHVLASGIKIIPRREPVAAAAGGF
jgi:hypothetical protein